MNGGMNPGHIQRVGICMPQRTSGGWSPLHSPIESSPRTEIRNPRSFPHLHLGIFAVGLWKANWTKCLGFRFDLLRFHLHASPAPNRRLWREYWNT